LLAPQFFSSFDLSEFDLVISSSNAYFAKAVKTRPGAVHICYCHTPARSLYGYTTMSDWQSHKVTHAVGTLINHYLRVVDFKVAQKVDYFIANSQETARRIKKFYRREASVIYPPVQLASPLASAKPELRTYYLYVNRLALAKHPEIAVQACNKMSVPLKVVGTGKMLEGLKEMAGPTVEFMGAVSDEQLHELYRGAKALLYPVEDEDFGIVPIEAMSHGVPVIAHASGGPLETIIEEKTGLFIHELSEAALVEAMYLLESYHLDRAQIAKHAQKFSEKSFQTHLQAFIKKHVS
jgi:glycosyltransferase involved in cell wall biosynthesis